MARLHYLTEYPLAAKATLITLSLVYMFAFSIIHNTQNQFYSFWYVVWLLHSIPTQNTFVNNDIHTAGLNEMAWFQLVSI